MESDGLSLLQILEIIRDIGIVAYLSLTIIGGFRGWYVWRWQYDEVVKERNTLREILKQKI